MSARLSLGFLESYKKTLCRVFSQAELHCTGFYGAERAIRPSLGARRDGRIARSAPSLW